MVFRSVALAHTSRYLQRHTQIPIPQIHAYGRDAKLTTDGKGTQMFIISDVVPGQMLDKKLLLEGDKEHTRNFYSQLIDIFTELRGLEFPSIGSLVPNPDGSLEPVVGPVMSMSAAELREPPHALFTSASDYLRYQFKLISEMFVEPVSKHTIEDIKREIFAVHGMEQVFDLVIDARSEKGPFVLSHLDLRTPNIIVNEQLQIQGVIDWEFAITVPSKLFTPPSWITGHDSPLETDKRMHVEFREVLDEKSRDNLKCDQLRREWYDHADDPKAKIDPTDLAFCVAHVLRRTGDLVDMYCDFFAGKLSDEPLEGAISKFFDDHPDLAEEAQRQVVQCKRYAEYLEENGLYETELSRLLAQSKAFKEKMGWA